MDLPQDVREVLTSILSKNPEDLTAHEVAFLNARRDYLNNEQKRVFASVLKDSQALHEEVVAKQQEQAAMPPTQYTDEVGEPVVEQVQEQPQQPTETVTPQVQTPASDVEQVPEEAQTVQSEGTSSEQAAAVQPEPVSQSEQTEPAAPTENTEAQASEVGEQPEQPEQPAVNENPYDVNVSEKDTEVA